MDHWVRISDEDLAFILDFDSDRDRTASRKDMVDVLHDIREIIEDGLETA